MVTFSFLLLSLLAAPSVCRSWSKLNKDLFTSYDAEVPPDMDAISGINVTVEFYLYNLIELEEVSGKFVTVGIYDFRWTDGRLTWRPDKYNDTDVIAVPKDKVWHPNTFLYQQFDRQCIFLGDHPSTKVRITHDGSVTLTLFETITSVCVINVEAYPLDSQVCSIGLSPGGYIKNEVRLIMNNTAHPLRFLIPNGVWDIVDVNDVSRITPGMFLLDLRISLKRKPLFVMLNTILPVALIGFLNSFVFLMPAECGERMGFSLSVLLTLAVFLTIVSDEMPNSSPPYLPLVAYYLLGNIILSIIVVLFNIVSLKIHFGREDEKMWNAGETETIIVKRIKELHQNWEYNLQRIADEGRPQKAKQRVCRCFDTLSLVFFFLAYTGLNVFFGHMFYSRYEQLEKGL